jgi:MFS family permease
MDLRPGAFAGRLANRIGIVAILIASLLLLGYVGVGEAHRTYPRFEVDRLSAQGELVQTAMQPFLQAGLPLEQFPGFTPLTQPLLESDPSIAAIAVVDPKGETLFANFQRASDSASPARATGFRTSALQEGQRRYRVEENDRNYRVSFELRNKFEKVGDLQLVMPKAVISNTINHYFAYVALAGVALLVTYTAAVIAITARTRRLERALLAQRFGSVETERLARRGARWLAIAYGACFLLMAAAVMVALLNIYAQGVRGKTEALGNSLSQRLDAPLTLGLALDDFTGLDQVLKDYQTLYPELSFIALTEGDRVVIDTDSRRVGTTWRPYPSTYEYTARLDRAGAGSAVHFGVHVGIPESVIYEKLWRGAKNFVVLFVASGFLAFLLFNLLQSFSQRRYRGLPGGRTVSDFRLGLVSPFYFLAVFVEALAVSFMPQHLQGLARVGGVDPGIVSSLFTVYFVAYGLSLLPASRYAQRHGTKSIMVAGIALTVAAMLMMAFVTNIYAMFPIRALAGFGQGLILAGVQTYILEVSAREKQTQGAGILVVAYNGGMISGMAMGALLAVYMGTQGVFILAACLAVLITLYAASLLPNIRETPDAAIAGRPARAGAQRRLWASLGGALKELGFLKAILLIGIPSKAILAGVTIFAMPLMLSRQNFAQEDIGQIIMFFAAGVLISNIYVSRWVDRIGKTTGVLFIGTLVSAAGLFLTGLLGWDTVARSGLPYLAPIVAILGMAVLGLAQGFITAPILTHVANSAAALRAGRSATASLYRFLERFGHMTGPLLVSQLLILNHQSTFTLSLIGGVIAVFGLLFVLGWNRGVVQPAKVPT